MDGTHKPDQATSARRHTPRSWPAWRRRRRRRYRNIGDQETTAAAASLSAQPVRPSPVTIRSRASPAQTSYFADERTSTSVGTSVGVMGAIGYSDQSARLIPWGPTSRDRRVGSRP